MDRSKAYSLLGLAPGAGEDDVKAAYRALAQKYNLDNYEAGPLRDDASAKMEEINEAFDTLMSLLRAGTPEEATRATSSSATGQAVGNYPQIRSMINTGRVDEALAQLTGAQDADNAEWNFLMGSAYYYKGWLDQALYYFQAAVRIAPGNREYEAALRNLQGNANGRMQGNPYGASGSGDAAMNCACNTCGLICCMDACCGMGRGC